jgi:predicted permease
MNWFKQLFSRRRLFNDLSEEIQAHLEENIEELVASGMPRKEAAAARREFGNVTLIEEDSREVWQWPSIENFLMDIRYGARMLRKSPGFTAVAILTLALGIGANTAIFSLIDTVFLRSLPVRDPEHLFIFKWTAHTSPNTKGYFSYMACPPSNPGTPTPRVTPNTKEGGEHGCSFSYPMFREFQSLRDGFSDVAALGGVAQLNLTGNGPAAIVRGELVSGEFFDTLGVGPAVGRTLDPSDDKPGATPVAVLGYGYWQSAFGGDPAVIGRAIRLNNIPVTIVGVAAKEFPSLDPSERRQMWLPLSVQPQLENEWFGNLGGEKPSLQAGDDIWWLYVIARLKPGITPERARAPADAVFRTDILERSKTRFKTDEAPRLAMMPAPLGIVGMRGLSRPLTILMLAVGIVLLIACANVAGLTVARSAARQREMAVRFALGAGRARIVRQLLTESLLLSAVGGTSGILLAHWSERALVGFMSRGGMWPSHMQVHLNLRILTFAVAASILTGILFGLAPAVRGIRMDLTPALKENTSAFYAGSSRGRWLNLRGGLVIAQVALSILVLVAAGLLVRTLANLKSIDVGFDTRNLLLFEIDPTVNGYTDAKTRNLYSELQIKLEALPAVLSATYSFDPLLSGDVWSSTVYVQGAARNSQGMADMLAVGSKFFETMRIPLLAGRTLAPIDFNTTAKPEPVVINERFARHYFGNENPLGRRFGGTSGSVSNWEIVGVVGDAKYQYLRSEIEPTGYVPQRNGSTTFEVRTAGDPAAIIPAIRDAVSQLDANLPVFHLKTQSEQIDRSLFQGRLIARLSSFFGGLSLLLACIGLYGLLSYEVTRRTREIGVRMALGAHPSDIVRFVVRQGLAWSAAGAIIGIVGALAATRYIASLLYGVRAADPLTFAGVALLLELVAAAACYLPARRAMRVDPMVALRHE